MTKIIQQLVQTEVNVSLLEDYIGSIHPEMIMIGDEDEGFCDLTPDRYITIRFEGQTKFYKNRISVI